MLALGLSDEHKRFQSTRPRGARHGFPDTGSSSRVFQSTRPRGARPKPIGAAGVEPAFQSTRPRGARLYSTYVVITKTFVAARARTTVRYRAKGHAFPSLIFQIPFGTVISRSARLSGFSVSSAFAPGAFASGKIREDISSISPKKRGRHDKNHNLSFYRFRFPGTFLDRERRHSYFRGSIVLVSGSVRVLLEPAPRSTFSQLLPAHRRRFPFMLALAYHAKAPSTASLDR